MTLAHQWPARTGCMCRSSGRSSSPLPAQGVRERRYLALLPPGEPFQDWSHHDRYAHRRHFSEQHAQRHREAADEVRGVAELALEDSAR